MSEADLKIAAILLAAGQSSRMAPKDKLLLPISGQPMIAHVASQLLDAAFEAIHVILPASGFDGREQALSDLPVKSVRCPTAHNGMGASIAFAMGQIDKNADAVLIALADMPDITTADINKLITATSKNEIVALGQGGKRRNPVLFGRTFFPLLAALSEDYGARNIINAHKDAVRLVEAETTTKLMDIDTNLDWHDWNKQHKHL